MTARAATVARYTLVELSRRRLLLVFLVIEGVLVIGVGLSPTVLRAAPGEDSALVVLSTLSGVAGGAILLCAIGAGMTVIRNDVDSGAIAAILARPVSRFAYAGGKLAAASLLLIAVALLLGLATVGLLVLNGGSHLALVPVFFAVQAANAVIWMVIVMALTVYLHNVLAAVIGVGVLFLQSAFAELHTLVQSHVVHTRVWATLSETGYWLLPHPLTSNLEREVVQSSLRLHPQTHPALPLSAVPSASGLGDVAAWLAYLVIVCALLYLALRRKQV